MAGAFDFILHDIWRGESEEANYMREGGINTNLIKGKKRHR